MQKTLSLFVFLLFSLVVKAQNIRFEGLIVDSQANGLEMANVMAINQNTNAMDSYAITNDKGKFQLSLKANASYKIKVSFIGFQPKEIELKTASESIIQNIVLQEGIDLDQVELSMKCQFRLKAIPLFTTRIRSPTEPKENSATS